MTSRHDSSRPSTTSHRRLRLATATTLSTAASPLGVMGYHYANPALAGQSLDPLRPSVLLYLPSPDGPTLAGVEYLQPDADQDTAASC